MGQVTAFTVIAGDTFRSQALAVIELLDPTVPGGPGTAALVVTATDPHVRAHLVEGTLVLTGRPELAVPNLATTAAALHATVQRAGRPAQVVTVDVPAASALPFRAPPVRLDVAPIAVLGSVTAGAFPHAPIAGAAIAVAGTVPDGRVVAVRTAWVLPHPAGAVVRDVVLTTAAGTTTAAAVTGGASTLDLAAAAGVVAGSVLALGPVETAEHVVVDTMTGTRVTLRTPTARTWPVGTTVSRVTVAAGAATALSRDVRPGDGLLVTVGPTVAAAVEIADANPDRVEYRVTGALADADGRWRLAGVRGIPSLTLTVSAAGFVTTGPSDRRLDAGRDPNVLDTVLAV